MPKTQHVVFFPVYGLTIAKEIGLIELGRVTFVPATSIGRLRRRLGLKFPLSEYRSRMLSGSSLFGQAPVYGCMKTLRDPHANDTREEQTILSQAFWLLASSFFFDSREYATPSLSPIADRGAFSDVSLFDRTSAGFKFTYRTERTHTQAIDSEWKRINSHTFFPHLARIENKRLKVADSKWKATLRRAAMLAGRSFLARHVAEAFFYDMVALETLLTKQGDKFPDAIVHRLAALFGWMTGEDMEPWKNTIDHLYRLRCSYVHDGESREITGADLHGADTLLKNILNNLFEHVREIGSKSQLLRMADDYLARRTLGLKPKRPKTFHYSYRPISESDIAKLNDVSGWSW